MPSSITTESLAQSHVRAMSTALTATGLDPLFWAPTRVGSMSSWWGHVPFAHWLVAAMRPGMVVELGTHNGVSFAAFCEAMLRENVAGRCYAVDTWEGDEHAGFYGDEVFHNLHAFNQSRYGAFAKLLRLTFDEALGHFDEGSIDLLHIDGLHTYEAVARDFNNWLPKLSDRGVVLFHDTNVRERNFGVWRLWAELKGQYPSFEFHHAHGLGIAAVGSNTPEPVSGLCALEPDIAHVLRERLAQLGARWVADDRAERAEDRAERAENRAERAEERSAQVEQHNIHLVRHVADCERHVAEAEHRVARRVRAEQDLSNRIGELDRENQRLRKELDSIYSSTSWHVTGPLRAMKVAGVLPMANAVGRLRMIVAAGRSMVTALESREKRSARWISDDQHFPTDRMLPERETVVIAVHEATRTGAAILAWNIIFELKKRFNVVALLKQGGPIEYAISDASTGLITLPEDFSLDASQTDLLARRIVERYSPKYLIANSAETRYFVRSFESVGVPTVLLIHEFSSTVSPPGALDDVFRITSQVVFSADIVADSALTDYRDLKARPYKVIAQGVSRLPPAKGEETAVQRGPEAWFDIPGLPRDDGSLLVIGIGTINFRKGIEFFIAAAAAVKRRKPTREIVFAWVGGCNIHDQHYLDYLNQQIERSEVGSSFIFLGELEDLDPVYARADICFLSSRLDPLPNIAIDSVVRGIPIICFERASGIAEILKASEATRELVVPYLDAAAAAEVVLGLAENSQRLAAFSQAMRVIGSTHFDMVTYVEAINRLGHEAVQAKEQEARDFEPIARSGKFNAQLYLGRLAPSMSVDDAIKTYLHVSRLVAPQGRPRTGLLLRRPVEGFHPLIYASEHPEYRHVGNEDPLSHYIRSGCRPGRWQHTTIRPDRDVRARGSPLRVAVHGHFHYPDLLADFLARLARNATPVDLLLTTTSEDRGRKIAETIAQLRVPRTTVMVMPNRGRDISPLLTGLGLERLAEYDVIGHFHGKRTTHENVPVGEVWRTFIWEHLVGGENNMTDIILSAFESDTTLGLVFPEDPHLNDWDDNRAIADSLATRMGLPPLPVHLDFPQGNMFWARPAALAPLATLGLTWNDYPDEPLPTDGTILHALERLVPLVAEHAGYRYATTYVKAWTR